MIVDLGRVEGGDGTTRKEKAQKVGAGVGQLVQCKTAARDLGEDRQKPGPGRRLEYEVTGVRSARPPVPPAPWAAVC